MRESRFDLRAFVWAWATLAWVVAIAIAVVNYPITTWLVLTSSGVVAVVTLWYWAHTYERHAWSGDRWAFWRLLWRKLTRRE